MNRFKNDNPICIGIYVEDRLFQVCAVVTTTGIDIGTWDGYSALKIRELLCATDRRGMTVCWVDDVTLVG